MGVHWPEPLVWGLVIGGVCLPWLIRQTVSAGAERFASTLGAVVRL